MDMRFGSMLLGRTSEKVRFSSIVQSLLLDVGAKKKINAVVDEFHLKRLSIFREVSGSVGYLASKLLDPVARAQQPEHTDFSPTLWDWATATGPWLAAKPVASLLSRGLAVLLPA